jgi:hypothetical protein
LIAHAGEVYLISGIFGTVLCGELGARGLWGFLPGTFWRSFLGRLNGVKVPAYFLVGGAGIAFAAALLIAAPLQVIAGSREKLSPAFAGIVWEKRGDWHLNGSGTRLRLGDAVPPGSLLTAAGSKAAQSTVILLPDGQRLLCECYDAKACSQGFRIPAIVSAPSLAVWEMFVGVQKVLLARPAADDAAFEAPAGHEALAAHVEIVSAVSPQGEISIASALRVLPPGRYALALTSDGGRGAGVIDLGKQPLDWAAADGTARVRVPGPGVYRIRVSDTTLEPRIEIEALATMTGSFAEESAGLKHARETILEWSHTHEGWPLHDFLRAYLQSRGSVTSENAQ